MPWLTEGAFRVFFFSFFGLMVSVLGLARRLPILFALKVPPPTDTWGIELTVSVSTVMCFDDPSPTDLFRGGAALEDFPAMADDDFAINGMVDTARILTSLFPPLSLPLSFLALSIVLWVFKGNGRLNAPSIGFSCSLFFFPDS